jgi:hypothetical protein
LLALEENNDEIVAHLTDYDNPHQVTKLQVGLSDVDNTSDSVKPISVYTQAALDLKSNIGHMHTGTYEPANANIQSHIADGTIHYPMEDINITLSQISDFTTPDETDPVFTASPAADITIDDITNLGNLSGINTGDQDLSGYSLTTHNHTGVYEPIRGVDDFYVTSAEKDVLANTSGINTGDQDLSGYSLTTHNHDGTYEPANSNIQTHISALVAHGTVGNIVGTTDLQTLTNKTLDANTVSTYVKFLPVAKPAHQQGILYYDSVEDALSYYNSVSGMSNQLGREIWVRVYNNTGTLIPNGHAVAVISAYNGTSTIDYADSKDYDKSRVVGVTTMDIPNGTYGYVTFFGRVNDIDTSLYTPGTILYLNTTAPGHYNDTIPTGGEYKVRIGRVVVQSATLGAIEVHVGQSEYTVETISERGFPDKSLLTLTWSDATRTLTITPIGTDYRFYQNGEKYDIDTVKTIQITDVEGSHFIYFDNTTLYDLVNGTQPQIENLIRNYVPVAYVYWNATDKVAVSKGIELHWSKGYGVENHIKDHSTEGARYASGLALTDIIVAGNGSLASHAQFGSQSGTIYDEDIKHSIPAMVSTVGATKILYRNTSLYPRAITNTGYSVATTGTGRLAYSPITGGLLECPDNTYVWYHVFAFGSVGSTDSIVTYMGTNYFSSTTNAYNGLLTDVVNLQSLGLPTPEFKLIASVLFQTRDTYANAVNARIVAADTAGSAYVDWRKEKFTGGSGVPGGGGSTTSSFSDLDFNVYDNVDVTKIAKFQADGITTATTRLYTFPDKDGTFAMLSDLNSSAGHTIQDDTTTYPTRTNLKFTGNLTVTDDSINDATVVNALTPTTGITSATTWDGTSYSIPLSTQQILKRTINSGVTTLTFALTYPGDASTNSRLVTVELDNSLNGSAISTITFTGTWAWGLGVQPTGLAAGGKAVLNVYNNSATSVRASWETTA